MNWIRHGDVVLEKVQHAKGTQNRGKNVVLAEGEVTGHKHVLSGQVLVSEHENQRFVELEQDTELVHEEHDTLTVPKGVYAVRVQRETDLVQQTRTVMD